MEDYDGTKGNKIACQTFSRNLSIRELSFFSNDLHRYVFLCQICSKLIVLQLEPRPANSGLHTECCASKWSTKMNLGFQVSRMK